MKEKKFIFTLLFSTYFNTLECKFPSIVTGKKNDMVKFLSTTEPIWTHTTHPTSGESCVVDLMQPIVNSTIHYSHSGYHMVKAKQTKFTIQMTGDLDKTGSMYSYEQGHVSVKFKHEVKFLDEANHCAVINILPMSNFVGQHSTDLRVWNSSIKTGPSKQCQKHYGSITGQGTVIYQTACQQILSNKQSPQQAYQQAHGKGR